MTRRLSCFLSCLLLLAACAEEGAVPDNEPIAVSVIGPRPTVVDPSHKPVSAPAQVLLSSVMQGLVRLDASGQIEPGAAIRWDVSDDGLYYTFRLDQRSNVDAEAAARRLRSAIGPTSRNPLKQELAAIAEVVAVTDEVIEIRLRAPRPDLLQLLAQPDLALIGDADGNGPFRIASREAGVLQLVLVGDADAVGERSTEANSGVTLRGEPAPLAVARFARGGSGVVLGGRFTDLALARLANGGGRALRLDPAAGLFGFAIVEARGVLSAPENRRALAMAIDRDRILGAFADGWVSRTGIVPNTADDLPTPAVPNWTGADLVARTNAARAILTEWLARNPEPAPIRVAVPSGTAARLLFTLVAIDWRRIGVEALAVPIDKSADLRLIDLVAPTAGAAWYLHHFSCDRSPVCSEQADLALAAAREAPTLAGRSALLAEADRRLSEAAPFIALGSPLRWALVAPNLDGYRDNPRALHPLDQLRDPD